MAATVSKSGKRAKYDIQLDRHEAKYVIPVTLLPDIREFIRPFCEPDPYTKGDPPTYRVTTLQLDTPDFALHNAKEHEALNRFKLRIRTYGEPGENPVFLEIKRKIRSTIVKSRTSVPFDAWGPHLLTEPMVSLEFKSRKEEIGFLEFRRLTEEIGARPVVLVRYVRESYFGRIDHYARISFDRRLEYQPTTSWTSWGRGGRWIPMDSSMAQDKQNAYSGVVLELKTLSDAPKWMIDLVVEFGLERTGNCKYSTALWLESVFSSSPPLPEHLWDALVW